MSVVEINRVIHFFAGRIDSGDEHHVVLSALDYCIVDLFDILGRGYTGVVDVKNYESVLDAGGFEFSVFKACYLKP